MLNVMFIIKGEIFVKNIKRVLTFLIGFSSFWTLNDDIRNSITYMRSCSWVSFSHSFRKFNMNLFICIPLLSFFGFLIILVCLSLLTKSFCDDQHLQIDLIHQKIRYHSFAILNRSFFIFVYQNFIERVLNHISHKLTVVSSNSLDTFSINVIILIWFCM